MKTRNLLFLVLTLLLSIQACTKADSAIEDAKDEIENLDNSKYLYFVSGKINGEPFIYGQKEDDTKLNFQIVTAGGSEGVICIYAQEDGTDAKAGYNTIIYPNFDDEDTQPSFGVYFDRFYRCSNPNSAAEVFNSLFPAAKYEYSEDDDRYGTMNQIGMGYSPTSTGDKYYSSYLADQSNSSFEITLSEDNNSLYGYSQMVEGKFSVTLSGNTDGTDILEITEGKFKLPVSR